MRWLNRRIAAPGPFLTLCLDQAEFDKALAHLRFRVAPDFVSPGSDATTHLITGPRGLACVVCLDGWHGRDPIEVAGLLVHEAVHVWQAYAEQIGERDPGAEQEAYGVQAISQELMSEFARRIGAR